MLQGTTKSKLTQQMRIASSSLKLMEGKETVGGEIKFTRTTKGQYSFDSGKADFWAFLKTMSSQVDKCMSRAVDRAKANHFQNILVRPGRHQLMDVAIKHLIHIPISKGDSIAAEDILGQNLKQWPILTPLSRQEWTQCH